MNPPKNRTRADLNEAADNLVRAAEKLRDHGKKIDALDWPREMVVPYTQLRNAVNRAVTCYDQVVQDRRRAAHKRAAAENLRNSHDRSGR